MKNMYKLMSCDVLNQLKPDVLGTTCMLSMLLLEVHSSLAVPRELCFEGNTESMVPEKSGINR